MGTIVGLILGAILIGIPLAIAGVVLLTLTTFGGPGEEPTPTPGPQPMRAADIVARALATTSGLTSATQIIRDVDGRVLRDETIAGSRLELPVGANWRLDHQEPCGSSTCWVMRSTDTRGAGWVGPGVWAVASTATIDQGTFYVLRIVESVVTPTGQRARDVAFSDFRP